MRDVHQFKSTNRNLLHHLAIIDYLQDYTFRKMLERKGKALFFNCSQDVLSVAPPDLYGLRFRNFMLDNVVKEANFLKDTLLKHSQSMRETRDQSRLFDACANASQPLLH